MANLPELLKTLVEASGSDLHIATNTPPQMRVHGHLQRIPGNTDLTPAETKQLVYSVLTDSQKKRFEETKELDFSFAATSSTSAAPSARSTASFRKRSGASATLGCRRSWPHSPIGRAAWCS